MAFETVLKTISDNDMIEYGDSIVVAVSGGPDSVCLLHMLNKISQKYSLNIYVAHLNHQIRGLDAYLDSLYVMKLCDKFEIPCFIKSIDVPKYCEENKLGLEDGARILRYKMFNEIKTKVGANKIAIGHNKNDQVETILMRIIRGTGLQGLRGIEYKRKDGIIRPILDLKREEIESYCADNNLNPRIDKTNLEAIYSRNKIRLELIPYIEKEFNDNFIDSIIRMGYNLRSDSDYILSQVKKIYSETVKIYTGGVYIFIEKFCTLHDSIKSRIVFNAIKDLIGDVKGIDKKHINDVIDLLPDEKINKMINLPKGIFVYRKESYILLSKEEKKENYFEFDYPVLLEHEIFIPEIKKTFKSEIMDIDNFNNRDLKKGVQYVDFDKLNNNLRLRNRRQGDKIRLLGGTKKIKELFIGLKIPRENRNFIPILTNGDDIVAVCDYRVSSNYKLDDNTKKVLVFTIE